MGFVAGKMWGAAERRGEPAPALSQAARGAAGKSLTSCPRVTGQFSGCLEGEEGSLRCETVIYLFMFSWARLKCVALKEKCLYQSRTPRFCCGDKPFLCTSQPGDGEERGLNSGLVQQLLLGLRPGFPSFYFSLVFKGLLSCVTRTPPPLPPPFSEGAAPPRRDQALGLEMSWSVCVLKLPMFPNRLRLPMCI